MHRVTTKNVFKFTASVLSLGIFTGCGDIAGTVLKDAINDVVTVRTISHSTTDQVREVLERTNQKCPIAMDAFTTLERVEVLEDDPQQPSLLERFPEGGVGVEVSGALPPTSASGRCSHPAMLSAAALGSMT